MEITNVLAAFARLADEGTLDELGTLFAEDVEWSMTGTTWRGRAEVLAGLGSMRELGHAGPKSGNRHVLTNQEVDSTATVRRRARTSSWCTARKSWPSARTATNWCGTGAAGSSPGGSPRMIADLSIRQALDRAIELGEKGIAVAAYHRGELIVDAVAGADSSTLFPIFSVTKGVTATTVHLQAERGLVDLQAPVARYWPEFGCRGKETVTVEQALSHRAGIPQMPDGVTPEPMADWDWMTGRIAGHTPIYEPGTANAYHVLVWGWIVGEVVRRTDPVGRSFDRFVAEEICAPLGITDFHLGVPDADLSRVAKLYGGNEFAIVDEHNICPPAVFPGSDVHNQRMVLQTVDPGAGAVATAGAVARIFAMLAEGGTLDGVGLLSPERVATFTRPRENAHDPDKVLTIPVWFGANGFWLGGVEGASDPLVGDHRDIIYSPGAGGSLAWADLRDRVAVAICHNDMDTPEVVDPERTFAPVVRAIREIVNERERR